MAKKKVPAWVLASLAAATLVVGGMALYFTTGEAPEPARKAPAEQTRPKDTFEHEPSPTPEPTPTPAPAPTPQRPAPEPAPQPQPPARQTITTNGVYVGRIDNNFIEVEINGEPTTFLYPAGQGEEFFEGDDVSIDYFVNERGQLEVVDIRYLSPTRQRPPDVD